MLDTNICIYALNNRPEQVAQKLKNRVGQVCISAITYGELVYGAEFSQAKEKTLNKLDAFIANLVIEPYDYAAAAHYGNIKAALRATGKLISDNDTHIAAHARSKGLVIVTNNTDEFIRVDGLRVENWVLDLAAT